MLKGRLLGLKDIKMRGLLSCRVDIIYDIILICFENNFRVNKSIKQRKKE